MDSKSTAHADTRGIGSRLQPFGAVLLDLDGVLTPTAEVHRAAWRATFDALLATAPPGGQVDTRPFSDDDYRNLVDGKSREDGVRAFLASRHITLAERDPDDSPTAETVQGIGNRKNAAVLALLEDEPLDAYPDSVALVNKLREREIPMAVVSASRNCSAVLAAAGLGGLFDAQVDGEVAARLGLAGKPSPDTFLAAADLLGVTPKDCVVIEDAIAGVAAGRAGRFGLVVGVARSDNEEALREAGADLIVSDLSELLDAGADQVGSR